jgi:hypothetical protein
MALNGIEYHNQRLPTPNPADTSTASAGWIISAKMRLTTDMRLGGLDHIGVRVAIYYIESSGSQICDTDTIDNANNRACNVWVVCRHVSVVLL